MCSAHTFLCFYAFTHNGWQTHYVFQSACLSTVCLSLCCPLSVCLSVCLSIVRLSLYCLSSVSHLFHISLRYLMEEFPWSLPQMFTMWVGVGEKVFRVRGQRSEVKVVTRLNDLMAEACILMMRHQSCLRCHTFDLLLPACKPCCAKHMISVVLCLSVCLCQN